MIVPIVHGGNEMIVERYILCAVIFAGSHSVCIVVINTGRR